MRHLFVALTLMALALGTVRTASADYHDSRAAASAGHACYPQTLQALQQRGITPEHLLSVTYSGSHATTRQGQRLLKHLAWVRLKEMDRRLVIEHSPIGCRVIQVYER